MIVDARMDTWEILTRFVQKKTTKKEMICVKTPNADPMQFVIWANVFALQDSKEMIPMTLLLVVLLYPNVLTIRIVATTKYVPFCLIQCIGNVLMPVLVQPADPTPTVSPITTTWLAFVTKDFPATPTTCRRVANKNLAVVQAKIAPLVHCVKSTFLAKRHV